MECEARRSVIAALLRRYLLSSWRRSRGTSGRYDRRLRERPGNSSRRFSAKRFGRLAAWWPNRRLPAFLSWEGQRPTAAARWWRDYCSFWRSRRHEVELRVLV